MRRNYSAGYLNASSDEAVRDVSASAERHKVIGQTPLGLLLYEPMRTPEATGGLSSDGSEDSNGLEQVVLARLYRAVGFRRTPINSSIQRGHGDLRFKRADRNVRSRIGKAETN